MLGGRQAGGDEEGKEDDFDTIMNSTANKRLNNNFEKGGQKNKE